jgi:hypothetical protein
MRLPDHKSIGAGLRRWRGSHNWTATDVAKQSDNKFKSGQVTKWENGKSSFSYKKLVEVILPAYEIDDFDVFVDFCHPPSLTDIAVINTVDFTKSPIAPGTVAEYLTAGFLKDHRTRIDRVTFAANASEPTPWGRHDGHEFLLVLKGAVVCEFADREHDERKKYTLTTGMAVAFPSSLFHQVSNANKSEAAEIVAARPSRSGPAPTKQSRDK